MQKVMMTWASGDAFCHSAGFRLYMKTAQILSDYDKFVFTHDMSSDTRRMIEAKGFQVIYCRDVYFVMRDRHLHYNRFLRERNYDFAVVTDSRDVLFQQDPAGHLSRSRAYVVCEGFQHGASGFNSIEQFEFQQNVAQFKVNMSNRPVLNGGTMFGNPLALADLFLNIWLLGVKTIGRCTDQAALNYLWNMLQGDARYSMIDPPVSGICLTGEGVKVCRELGKPLDVQLVDGIVRRAEGPYCVVHQWDRLDFASELLAHYDLSVTLNDSTEGANAKP